MSQKRLVNVIVLIAIVLVGAVLIMKVLSGLRKDPPKKPPKENIRLVKVKKVTYGDIESQVAGSGRLASTQQVDMITEVQGIILPGDVPLKKGQSFRKGQLLFRVFDEEAKLTLLGRKSRFLNAIANLLPDFKVDFPGSHKKWAAFLQSIDIQKDLPPLPGIDPGKEKIFLAGRNILSDYYTIKADEVRLKKYKIVAQFDGTFTSVLLEAGAVANPGSRIAKIIRTDQLELEVPIEPRNARWIKKGDKVLVTTDDASRQWTGTVVRKTGFIDEDSQSIGVFVQLASSRDNPLYLGLYLKAVFPGIRVQNAMQIPRNAVFNTNEVFIVKEGRLAKHEISIHKVDENTLIFSGIAEGANVVVEPLVNAAENMKVQMSRAES